MASVVAAWPTVALGSVLRQVDRAEAPVAGRTYRTIGVKWWGEGVYEREPIDGSQTQYSVLRRIETNDVIINKIWARHGSVAVVQPALNGAYASGEFPTWVPDPDRLSPRWMHWLSKTKAFWAQCEEKSRGTSGKNRIRPEKFLAIEISLPHLDEQRRIVARIEELAARVEETRRLRREARADARGMLMQAYSTITDQAPLALFSDVAPLQRRPVPVDIESNYPELGIRSFGKGTFHKPALPGASVGTKRLFAIRPGDLLFNIVFAWEGAVAVARPEDDGRVGSHRFLTCVPDEGVAKSEYLCFHFLTAQGLEQLGAASPGGAGRNRTLGLKALEAIQVPLPSLDKQVWFEGLIRQVRLLNEMQESADALVDALLPSILDTAFRGDL